MAHLNRAHVIEIWQSKLYDQTRYMITKNHRIVMVHREAFASAKMGYIGAKSEDDPTLRLNFRGRGRFAHSENDPQVREFLFKYADPEVKLNY